MALAVLSLPAAWLLAYNIHLDRTRVTPGTIKLYLDKMPSGICCWRENGRVLFSNICMNNLCLAITGAPLLNGNQFHDALGEDIVSVDQKVWRFATREIFMDNERLFEMIASDITAEYATTKELEKDKAELTRLNQELWEYYLRIDESVQRQEILQAKVNIHDEMNRLMLSSMAADKEDTEALKRIFSLWEQNALLLGLGTEQKNHAPQGESVASLAPALGIDLRWSEEAPAALDEKQQELFFFTAQEAMINAVKHARAKHMEIAVTESDEAVICRFINDGMLPTAPVRFEGGLGNLARLAAECGASLDVIVDEKFTLLLKYHSFG